MLLRDSDSISPVLLVEILRRPFQVQKDLGQPGKGHGHYGMPFGKLTSYTWGKCSVGLTGSQLQSISSSFPFILLRCSGMDPAVISTPHFWHGIHLHSSQRYDAPPPCISNPRPTRTFLTAVLWVGDTWRGGIIAIEAQDKIGRAS